MATERRQIGKCYDKEIFDAGFRRAAHAIVAESYASPDTPTGLTLQEMFVEAMEKRIAEMPTVYYQMLEGIARGESAAKYADGSIVEMIDQSGNARLGKMMMELAVSSDETKISVREPESAELYYTGRFPENADRRETSDDKGRRRLNLPGLGLHGKTKEHGKHPSDKMKIKQDPDKEGRETLEKE